MKTVLFLRHAHAEASSQDGSDFNRPLSGAGRDEARQVGQHLLHAHLTVDEVICSTALRTRETAAGVIEAARFRAPLHPEQAIYEAPAEELLAVLRGRPADTGRLLLIGHNPGIPDLVSLLTAGGGLAMAFAPATLAVVDFEGGWKDLAPGRGVLRSLTPVKAMG